MLALRTFLSLALTAQLVSCSLLVKADPDALDRRDTDTEADVADDPAAEPDAGDGTPGDPDAEPAPDVEPETPVDVVEEEPAADPVEDPIEEEPTNPYSPLDFFTRNLRIDIEAKNITSDSTVFDVPTAYRSDRWAAIVDDILAGDWTGALTLSMGISLTIYAVHDSFSGRDYIVVHDEHHGEGIYVFDPVTTSGLVVEVPYPLTDAGTLAQGIQLLRGAYGRALLIAGATRCTEMSTVICDGTTVACGSAESFRESDAAHNPNLIFHRVHDELRTELTASVSVQLQGQSDASGAHAILSDGTTFDGTSTTVHSIALRDALKTELPTWVSDFYSCNDPADSDYTSACQTTNVQGRLTNGSTSPCGTAASSSSDRFIVLEQSTEMRDETRFDELVNAVRTLSL
jgi:hypothetical protein